MLSNLPRYEPLKTLSEVQFRQIRKIVISMVLATDTASHFSELSSFKTKLSSCVVVAASQPHHAAGPSSSQQHGPSSQHGGAAAAGGGGGGAPTPPYNGSAAAGYNHGNNKTGYGGDRNSNAPSFSSEGDKQTLLNILLHAADIGDAARPERIYLQHVQRIMEE